MFYESNANINNLGEYLEEIIHIKKRVSSHIDGEFFQWYRGHADKSWDLIPKIQREFTGSDENLFRKERCFTNDFQARASLLQKDNLLFLLVK